MRMICSLPMGISGVAYLVSVSFFFSSSNAFTTIRPSQPLRHWGTSSAVSDKISGDNHAEESMLPPDILTPGLSRLLTQRAIQQQAVLAAMPSNCLHEPLIARVNFFQLYYYALNSDETSAGWLSGFMQPDEASSIQEEYHGINALPTSDSSSFLCALLAHTEVEITVKALMGCSAGRGHGGINGATGLPINRSANPYLQPRYREYQVTLRPNDMADKLLTIRAQIAAELAEDAAFLLAEGKSLTAILNGASSAATTAFPTPQSLVPSGFVPSEHTAGGGGRASPFRIANFDLLRLLATTEALQALALSDGGSGNARKMTREAIRAAKAASSGDSKKDESISSSAKAVLEEFLPQINANGQWTQAMDQASLADVILHHCISRNDPDGFALAHAVVLARSSLATTWSASGVLSDDLANEQASWRRWHLDRFFSFSAA